MKLISSVGQFVFLFTSPSGAADDRNAMREIVAQVKPQFQKSEPSESGGAVKDEKKRGAADQSGLGIHVIEARRRAHVLANDAHIKLLHNELVSSGIVSEEDFWQARADELRNAGVRPRSQQRGVQSALVADLEPAARSTNREHYRLTPTTIRAIFVAAPPVQRAYQQLVPDRLSEQQFWAKYLAARHFHRARVKAKRKRVRTNESEEDAVLARAIADSERILATSTTANDTTEAGDESTAPPRLPLDVDMTANDDAFDRRLYGARPDYLMRKKPSHAIAALMARTNNHSARVLAADYDVPSITTLVRRKAAGDASGATANASDVGALMRDANDLIRVEPPRGQPLLLESRRSHTTGDDATKRNGTDDAMDVDTQTMLQRALHALAPLPAPPTDACAQVNAAYERAERADERARRESQQVRNSAGGATQRQIYEHAVGRNREILSELLLGADVEQFLEALYLRFARANELLRHYWGTFPILTSAQLQKATRVASAIAKLIEELDTAQTRVPDQQRGKLAPLLIELRARCNAAVIQQEKVSNWRR